MSFFDDEETEGWDAWNITFYGQVPQVGKESEGSITLDFDVVITNVDWKFPPDMSEGWKATVYANESPILELDLDDSAVGFLSLDETMVLPSGGSISARIYYAHAVDAIPQIISNRSCGHGYSIIVSGIQESSEVDPFHILKGKDGTDVKRDRVWKSWRREMV